MTMNVHVHITPSRQRIENRDPLPFLDSDRGDSSEDFGHESDTSVGYSTDADFDSNDISGDEVGLSLTLSHRVTESSLIINAQLASLATTRKSIQVSQSKKPQTRATTAQSSRKTTKRKRQELSSGNSGNSRHVRQRPEDIPDAPSAAVQSDPESSNEMDESTKVCKIANAG